MIETITSIEIPLMYLYLCSLKNHIRSRKTRTSIVLSKEGWEGCCEWQNKPWSGGNQGLVENVESSHVEEDTIQRVCLILLGLRHLDQLLAGVVPSEQSEERFRYAVKPFYNRLSVFDFSTD